MNNGNKIGSEAQLTTMEVEREQEPKQSGKAHLKKTVPVCHKWTSREYKGQGTTTLKELGKMSQ